MSATNTWIPEEFDLDGEAGSLIEILDSMEKHPKNDVPMETGWRRLSFAVGSTR